MELGWENMLHKDVLKSDEHVEIRYLSQKQDYDWGKDSDWIKLKSLKRDDWMNHNQQEQLYLQKLSTNLAKITFTCSSRPNTPSPKLRKKEVYNNSWNLYSWKLVGW